MSTTDSPHGKLMGPAAEYLRPATATEFADSYADPKGLGHIEVDGQVCYVDNGPAVVWDPASGDVWTSEGGNVMLNAEGIYVTADLRAALDALGIKVGPFISGSGDERVAAIQ